MRSYVWLMISCEILCLLGFIVSTSQGQDNSDDVVCPHGWQKIHRGCYQFVLSGSIWTNARKHCKDQDGDLLTIQSEKEKEDLEHHFKTEDTVDNKWWAGLQRTSEKSTDWLWLDNSPITQLTPWTNHRSKARQGKFCGILETPQKLGAQQKLTISIHPCDKNLPFVCEFHSITNRPTVNTRITTSTIIHGATITTFAGITTKTPDHFTNGGAIVGVHKTPGEKGNPTGGLYSSMRTVVSASDSVQNENMTTKISTKSDVPVPVTVRNMVIDGMHDTTERILDASQFLMTSGEDTSTAAQFRNLTSETSDAITLTPEGSYSSSTQVSQQTSTVVPLTTEPSWLQPVTPTPTMVDWVKAYKEFEGCYIPGTGGSLRDTVMTARRFYAAPFTSCPGLHIGSLVYPSVMAGQTAEVPCASGEGLAVFQCGQKPACWRGQPNVFSCSSKQVQVLSEMISHHKEELTIESAIEVSSKLIGATENYVNTMEDIIIISHIIKSFTRVNNKDIKDIKQTKSVIDNVVRAGSNLISTNTSVMWNKMSQEDKTRSAFAILTATEKATVSLLEGLNEPIVINKKHGDIEVELHVIDLEALKKEKEEFIYKSGSSENSFSIPLEILSSYSNGQLAKAVFMMHNSMSNFLESPSKKQTAASEAYNDTSDTKEASHRNESVAILDEDLSPRLASFVISASLAADHPVVKLPKPVIFTMKHLKEVDTKYTPLCSFWDDRQDEHFGFWSQEGCQVVQSDKFSTTCSCDHMTSFAILLDVHGLQISKVHRTLLRLVTILGCIISCFSLLASWITFQCFTALQGERNSIHKNLAVALLMAEILFVFGIDQASHQILCSVIAGFLHFFFLAAFTWMFIEGLHIIFMLVQVFDASHSRLPYYYLLGYGIPLVVVGTSAIFYHEGYGTKEFCWLTTEQYFIWAFAGPVALILLVNAVFLTYAMTTVCRHSDYVFSAKEKSNTSGIRAWIQGALALEVLLGLTWTLGYLLIIDESLTLAYIFAILNSLQGLFIFVFHCLLNKKVQKEYRQIVRTMVTRSGSSIATQSTITKRSHHINNSHELNSDCNSHQKLNASNSVTVT